ncbi:rod shape-determining protein RodA [Luminiphilus syltensis NOR5-1B]|uniref:Peptidoglycan glycosyltransferase MrdB n=1 Tax=Luminiphilus syltensis NOR5-1B TaxID=565045 RepID=B8KSM0_9GAMM|nr:rod shape-determining protein RodA [Luminiphilus syltensis]EED34345.1 rod shape-determining protein RodA [Luminiphilus syltensis NOR5-1B]
MADYERSLPGSERDFSRRKTVLQFLHIDAYLLIPLLALVAGGLVVLYSASNEHVDTVMRQVRNFVIGFIVMLAAAQIGIETYRRWAVVFYAMGLMLLVAVPFFGVGAKGAQRWLDLSVIRFQPSEIMKLAMPLMIAWWFSRYTIPPRPLPLIGSLLLVALPAGLIVIQPDLGTSLLVAASGLFVIFMAGISWLYIGGAVALFVASAWPAWLFLLKDYQKQRILTLLDPESDKLGAGWNIIQSKTAIGSGGWNGKGWLEGTQSHLDFLPESQTDFIIAVLAEEFGLQGVLALLGVYLLLVLRGFWIGLHAQSAFGRLLAGAITLTFFVYIFVNMGMVAGILPVVGVPLPLISFGGTSVVTLMLGFGVLMAISTERRIIVQ